MRLRTAAAWGALGILGVLGGASCNDPMGVGRTSGDSRGWSHSFVPNVSNDAAFDAGLYAMRQWFRIEENSSAQGLIRGAPSEYDQRGGSGRLRDAALKFPNRLRRTATLVVRPQGTGADVRCMVRVERLDTADMRVFRDNERFEDNPSDTPIDREAGVTSSQDQVWTEISRDRTLEREILDVVRNRLSPPTTPSTAPAP